MHVRLVGAGIIPGIGAKLPGAGGLRGGTRGGASYGVLRKSVTREADRESGGGDSRLIIGIVPVEDPNGPDPTFPTICLNPT